jgi:uncharacterized protein YbgA (DUF1722 family)
LKQMAISSRNLDISYDPTNVPMISAATVKSRARIRLCQYVQAWVRKGIMLFLSTLTYIHRYVRTYMHTYIHKYVHIGTYPTAYIHRYVRTYIDTYT